ncbi:hypothetical protein [Rudanella lutea]|uniref:hypothetical protein n=1 Tax=Rudanella lutea TaxID=451374 RepID=UPI0012FA22DF|nr:hypothetical protein [Rudanella lutea]
MYDINFEPFVGKDYYSQSPKILVLGESHYAGEGDQQSDFTQKIVQENAQRQNGQSHRFFTLIAKSIDKQLDNLTAPSLWDRVAFYNYVQVIVGARPGIRPTNTMFANSDQAYRAVLERLKPDLVVVVGRRLASHLAWHKNYFGPAFPNYIACNWAHPASYGSFKIQEATQAFEAAYNQFMGD